MHERLATCCYCSRRAMLRDRDHHLVCGSCGAALTNMKPLKTERAQAASTHAPTGQTRPTKTRKPGKRAKPKKSFWRKVADEIIDEIFD